MVILKCCYILVYPNGLCYGKCMRGTNGKCHLVPVFKMADKCNRVQHGRLSFILYALRYIFAWPRVVGSQLTFSRAQRARILFYVEIVCYRLEFVHSIASLDAMVQVLDSKSYYVALLCKNKPSLSLKLVSWREWERQIEPNLQITDLGLKVKV